MERTTTHHSYQVLPPKKDNTIRIRNKWTFVFQVLRVFQYFPQTPCYSEHLKETQKITKKNDSFFAKNECERYIELGVRQVVIHGFRDSVLVRKLHACC